MLPPELRRRHCGFSVQTGRNRVRTGHHRVRELHTKEVILMKKFGLATLIAGGFTAAVVGLAGPADAATIDQAPAGVISSTNIRTDLDDWYWIYQIQPRVYVPHVSNEVHQSR
jgi:hypothetical protein